METVRDLSMDADEMQVVLSAISSVSRRIKEVAQTHKPLFGGEHFLTGKKVCERLYISPRTLQDYRDRKIIPYTQFAGKILYKASTWRDYWRIVIGPQFRSVFPCEVLLYIEVTFWGFIH